MIVLDTHIWHWWINQIPDKLPSTIIELIEQTDDDVAVSAISCFEMAWLVRHGRIDLGCHYDQGFEDVEASQCVRHSAHSQFGASIAGTSQRPAKSPYYCHYAGS